MRAFTSTVLIGYFLSLIIGVASFFAFWTAVIHDFVARQYLLVLVEAIVAPLGVFHGYGLWLGLCH